MTALWCLLWGFMIAISLMVLYDFAKSAVDHLRWRHRWKTDSVAEYNTYRNALDRARSTTPTVKHHRPSRQRR